MKFADPKNDIAFKKIFGDENKTKVLISFLNSILEFKNEKTIVSVVLNNPYQLPDIKELKETILDIKATNQSGEEFIVEMQKKNGGDFSKRSLYYTSKAYVKQIDKAVDYKKLKKVYYIALVNFNIFENANFISRHLIINQETMKQDLKDFEFNFIELKKFNLKLSECDTNAKKWIYFINNASDLEIIPQEYKNIEEFEIAFDIATKFSWSKKELDIYDSIDLRKADDINALRYAQQQGLEQGIEKGEKNKAIEIAKKLIKAGIDTDTITISTGLKQEQIKKLK